jgi:hypothetical protein
MNCNANLVVWTVILVAITEEASVVTQVEFANEYTVVCELAQKHRNVGRCFRSN